MLLAHAGLSRTGTGRIRPNCDPKESEVGGGGVSPETMSVAPTRLPDLGASPRAGCRLSLPASSLWFPMRW